MTIRPERLADVAIIAEITRDAFGADPHGSHTEHFIIESLRRNHALSVSLVAEVVGQVAGHIAFSPVKISDGSEGWYGLGPLAVRPGLQGRGIGQALVQKGLSALQDLGAQGCVVVGEPEFYGRFGFQNSKELVFAGVPEEYFLALPFAGKLAVGQVTYHEAFAATA